MTVRRRKELTERFWRWIDPTVHGYSKQISCLLDELSDEQLEEFIRDRVDDDSDDDREF